MLLHVLLYLQKKKKNDFNVLKLYVCGMAACDLERENSTGNWGKWVTDN